MNVRIIRTDTNAVLQSYTGIPNGILCSQIVFAPGVSGTWTIKAQVQCDATVSSGGTAYARSLTGLVTKR